MSDFNMDVLGIGDLLVNEGTQSLELNAFFTARNETLSSKNAPISRDLLSMIAEVNTPKFVVTNPWHS